MGYFWAFVYIIIGLAAASLHWAKKRYIDKTTRCGFLGYIKYNPRTTWQAVSAVIGAEIALAISHTGTGLSLEQFVAAVGAGYMTDSTFNEAPAVGKEGV